MKTFTNEFIIIDYWWRNCSTMGNPSYNITIEDSKGDFRRGHTASNSMAGYGIRNFKKGQKVKITYHYTQKNYNLIIDRIEEIKENA